MSDKKEKYLIGVGDMVDRLSIVNIKISMLESLVKSPHKTNEEAGIAAREIRKLNNQRIAIRNALNRMTESGFEDVRVEYFEIFDGKEKRD